MDETLGLKYGYLKGLSEELRGQLDANSTQGKLVNALMELTQDLIKRMDSMCIALEDLNDYVESIDDAVTELEERSHIDDDDDEDFDGEEGNPFAPEFLSRLFGSAGTEEEPKASPLKLFKQDKQKSTILARCCAHCHGVFFISDDNEPADSYICPHCGKSTAALYLDNADIEITPPEENPNA